MQTFHPIVLLTDFGTKDAYAPSMKGVIFTLFPEATVIDLSHEVPPQAVRPAAFLLESAYPYFPSGSIFVSVVDPGVGSERKILAARTRRGIFLAPDNGLLTRVLAKEKSYELRAVTNRKFFLKEISSTFHGRDCFAPAAARLAKDPPLFSRLGPRMKEFHRLEFPSPRVSARRVLGEILYFDYFGNAFTNISRGLLQTVFFGKKKFQVRVKGKEIGSLRHSYYQAPPGALLAVFSSTDLLEIAVNQGSAREKLKLREGDALEAS